MTKTANHPGSPRAGRDSAPAVQRIERKTAAAARYRRRACLIALLAALVWGAAPASGSHAGPSAPVKTENPPPALVIKGARLLPIAGTPIDNGTLVIRNGRIAALGREVLQPEGARVIEASGNVAVPGFFDAFSHAGAFTPGDPIPDYDEASAPLTPLARILDALDPESPLLKAALESGVTALLCAPGPGNVISGQSAVIRPGGKSAADIILLEPAAVHGGLGEIPKLRWGAKGRLPMTRMGEAALLRRVLLDARRFAEEADERRSDRVPSLQDLQSAALAPVIEGKIPLVLHADRLDDILTAVRLADESGARLIIQHGAEAGRAAGLLAEKSIPVLLGPAGMRFSRDETLFSPPDNALRLHRAGVCFAFQTGTGGDPAGLLREAAAAVAAGLPEEAALAALTLAPARIFDLDGRMGSLAPGKDADIVIFDGPPLAPATRIRMVIIGGRIVKEN